MLQMMFPYSHTDVEEEDLVFAYLCDRSRFSIAILMLQQKVQKMIQYSHTDATEYDLEYYSVTLYTDRR